MMAVMTGVAFTTNNAKITDNTQSDIDTRFYPLRNGYRGGANVP